MTDSVPVRTYADYDSWVRAIEAAPTDTTLRLTFADWLEEHDDAEEAVAQRAAAGRVKTRRIGTWAVGPSAWHLLREELIATAERRWIARTVCTTVHYLRGVPGGEIDFWIDDEVITPTRRRALLLETGSVPLDYPHPPSRTDPDSRLAVEVHDKIGSFAGRRWSIDVRWLHRSVWQRHPAAQLEIRRRDQTVSLALVAGGMPAWTWVGQDRSRVVTRPGEVQAIYLWHWDRYYHKCITGEDARACAEAFKLTLPAEGEDINELNRRVSRDLYAQARRAGWRKLTHREQAKYGLVGQWHRCEAIDARRVTLGNRTGCGDATLRAADGLSEPDFSQPDPA